MPAQFPNSDPVTATPQPTPFDSLLAQCRDLVSERLSLALSGMLDKVDDALSALISETRDANVQKLYSQTRDKALAQREAIEKQFRARYLREFQQRSNRVKKIGDSFADIDLSSLELELVGEEDLDETIKFNALAARLRQYCDEELIALDQRVGVLIGDASLQTEDNPFTPQAICDAYKDTCRQLDSNVDVRMVLLRLFDDHVVDEIRAVYKAVNALLIQNSILPKIRLSARKESGKPPSSGAKAAGEAPKATAQAEQKALEGEQDLFSILKNLRANAMPQAGASGATGAPVAGAAGADGVQAVLQGTELLGLLTRIQLGGMSAVPGNIVPAANSTGEPGMANVLRGLKDTSVGAGMNQLDVLTLDIMSLVFDQLFDDPKIPVGVKGLIGRLQIPMLKVAIADKTFFSKKTHPARQLLDTLGEISLRLPADFNASSPLFGRMEVILQELIDGFEANLEIFAAARGRLETLITEEDTRVEQDTLSAANRIEQKERLALAKTVAQAEIKARVRVGNVPVPVLEFLIQQWVQVLLVVHVVDSEDSDAWKNALETMDLLIWSVEPKHTLDERRELAVIVPEVRQRIAAGLKMVDIEDAVRSDFFVELRELHAGIIGKPEVDSALMHDASRANDAAISVSASAMQPESESAAELPPALVVEPAVAPAPLPAAQPESASVAELLPVPVVGPAAMPVSVPDLERATAPASVPVVEPAAVPAAKIASVPDLEIAQAPAVEVVPVPAVEPATAPAFAPDLEFAPAPAAEVTLVPAVEPATLPDLERATAPASVPAAQPESASIAELLPVPVVEPAATPVPIPDLEFAPAPAAEAAPVPVVESAATSVSVPDLEFTTAPTPQVTPAPAAEPAFLLDLEFIPAPAAEAAPAPAAQAGPASAAEFVSLPDLKFTPAPAAEPTSLPELNFAIEPAAQPAAAPPQLVPAPAAQPTAAPAAQPATAPAAKSTAAPTAQPAAVSAAQPAPAPAPAPVAQRMTAPAAQPAAAPAAKSVAASTARPAAVSAAQPAPAPAPAPAPVAQRMTAPAAQPAAAPAAKSVAASTARPAPTPAAQRVTAPPAAKPAATPVAQPVPASAAKATTAPAARPVPAPAAQSSPAPGKGVQPPPRSPAAPQSRSESNASASLDFTAPITVQNPFGGGRVQVEDLDFTVKPAAGAKRDAIPAELPGNLTVGTWVGIREKDEKDPRRSAKLSYISPLKTRYLFVDRQGKTTLDCSRADLARRFKIGEIVIMDKVPEVPLFDRITEGLVGKLGGGKSPR